MRNKIYIFYFSTLMVFMPFHVEGMEIAGKVKRLVCFLDNHKGALLMASVGVLTALSYEEVTTSEEEEPYKPVLQKQEDKRVDVKKISEQKQKDAEEAEDAEVSSMDLMALAVLWKVGSQ